MTVIEQVKMSVGRPQYNKLVAIRDAKKARVGRVVTLAEIMSDLIESWEAVHADQMREA